MLAKFGKDKKIKWIINCVGYTKIDNAEEEIDEAFRKTEMALGILPYFPIKEKLN